MFKPLRKPSLAMLLALTGLTAAAQTLEKVPEEPVASRAPLPAAKGSLVIIGGGLRADNADVWQKIVSLAGGKGARIAVFPSASGTPERAAATSIAS
jgi:cyanophycinase